MSEARQGRRRRNVAGCFAYGCINVGIARLFAQFFTTRRDETRRGAIVIRHMQVEGRTIAYLDEGSGPPVILLHCSSASHRMWSPLVTQLARRHRVLAPDLHGYGQSYSWPRHAQLSTRTDAEIVLALADRANAPLQLVGHSYGAAVALEASRHLGARVRTLTLIEPVAFQLLRHAKSKAEWNEIAALSSRVQQAVATGHDAEAAAAYMRYWIGAIRWWLMPKRARRAIIGTMSKVAAEFALLTAEGASLNDFAQVEASTRLIVGSRTRSPARAVVNALQETMPEAHTMVVPRAGHMSPFTHPALVHPLIVEHLEQSDSPRVLDLRPRLEARAAG